MKKSLLLSVVLFSLVSQAQAGKVQGYFVPDHLEKEVQSRLTYLSESAKKYPNNPGAKANRAKEIKVLQGYVNKLSPTDYAAATALGVPADLEKAVKLNSSNPSALAELADTYLNK